METVTKLCTLKATADAEHIRKCLKGRQLNFVICHTMDSFISVWLKGHTEASSYFFQIFRLGTFWKWTHDLIVHFSITPSFLGMVSKRKTWSRSSYDFCMYVALPLKPNAKNVFTTSLGHHSPELPIKPRVNSKVHIYDKRIDRIWNLTLEVQP